MPSGSLQCTGVGPACFDGDRCVLGGRPGAHLASGVAIGGGDGGRHAQGKSVSFFFRAAARNRVAARQYLHVQKIAFNLTESFRF